MFRKFFTYFLILSVLAPGQVWASACKDELKALHGIRTPSPEEKYVQQELELYVDDSIEAAKEKALSCKGQANCNKAVIHEAMNERRFGERFKAFFRNNKEKKCVIGKQRSARDKFIAQSNMALNLGAAGLATWGFYELEKKEAQEKGLEKPQFEWAFLAASVTFVVYRSIIQCRNELDKASLEGLTPKQKFWTKFWRYTKMNAIANSIFVSMLVVQDMSRGENPLDIENLKSYGLDFTFGMIWDGAWAVSHIKFFDALLLDSLPRMRRVISAQIQRGLLRPVIATVNGKRTLFLIVKGGTQIPGIAAEALSRVALTAGRTATYLEARSKVHEWVFGIPVKDKESIIDQTAPKPNIDSPDIAPTQ